MVDLVQVIIDDDQPLALRRKRRSSTSCSPAQHQSDSHTSTPRSYGITTPPETPKRSKKRVRFSDPGPELTSSSSGLTPLIRRSSLTTPTSKRRHSTPSTLSNRTRYDDTPICGVLQFAPLRQVLEGRVKRRLKRNRLSEEINIIEWERRVEAREKKSELEQLKLRLAAKDREVQSLQDEHELASQLESESAGSHTTKVCLASKVHELEQEIRDLKSELGRRELESAQDTEWVMAAHEDEQLDTEDHDMAILYDDDDDFRESELFTTPTKLRTTFPSPPSTMPNTPCKSISTIDAANQAVLPDPEKELLRNSLSALNREVSKLASSIAFNEDHHARLSAKLSDFIPLNESGHTALDSALDSILTQLALSQSQALENSTAFNALSNEICNLGFQASSPDEALSIIASQFRQARLELEYLDPGEMSEGFDNSKLLQMLISRLKVLSERVKSQDDSIDQYHEQELLLRQQIDSRVTVMDELRTDIALANSVVGELKNEINEKDVGNDRLRKALDGYREEVRGLEALVERIEREAQITEESLRDEVEDLNKRFNDEVMTHDLTRADNEGKSMILSELEQRLLVAHQSTAKLQEEVTALITSNQALVHDKDTTIESLKQAAQQRELSHGEALALRDARVSELRDEIHRINDALKTAHSTILDLRRRSSDLTAQVEGEKTRGRFVIASIQAQLKQALETGVGYVNGDISVQGPREVQSDGEGARRESPVRSRLFDAGLARRGSGKGKKRRRYDSGLGFLEEEEEEVLV